MKHLLMPAFALALAAVLALGCASPGPTAVKTQTVRYQYRTRDIAVLRGPQAEHEVDVLCHQVAARWAWEQAQRTGVKPTAHWDDGSPLDDRLIRSCFVWEPTRYPRNQAFQGTIYISEQHFKCAPHEECHADGRPEGICARTHPCIEDLPAPGPRRGREVPVQRQ